MRGIMETTKGGCEMATTNIGYDDKLVSATTGEVFDLKAGTKIVSPEEQKRKQEWAVARAKQKEDYALEDALRGTWYSIVVRDDNSIFGDVSGATINKIIYLGTYMDNYNALRKSYNRVVDSETGKAMYQSVYMTKQDVWNLLGGTKRLFYNFWNEAIEHHLLEEEDGKVYIMRNVFSYGSTKKIDKKKYAMVQMYKHAIRYMYENTNDQTRKWLVYLYTLIPYLNLKYNVLCINPFEQDKENIKPLTMGDICERLGRDRRDQTRILRGLKKLHFIDKQGDERSVIKILWDYKNEDRNWISINPQFYAGYVNGIEMQQLTDLFAIGENSF